VTDQLLNILKYALLALLYLFFARVLWAVWSEVRSPKQVDARLLQPMPSPTDPTEAAVRPRVAAPPKPTKGKRGNVGRLVVIEPKQRRGASWALAAEISVGRADSCTVGIVDDAFVSQLHARIFRQDDGVWVEDLGSTNGTFLNGRRITTIEPVAKGDRVQVGSTVLEAE
jgi:pSer/pThr/pTyr-binding forkhead associated (FHA) protein